MKAYNKFPAAENDIIGVIEGHNKGRNQSGKEKQMISQVMGMAKNGEGPCARDILDRPWR